jgi:hypothetical protein
VSTLRAWFWIVVASGCAKDATRPADEPPPQQPPPALVVAMDAAPGDAMPTSPIAVELEVQPAELTAANRNEFRVTVTVHNFGADVIDPQLNLSELTVDGARSNDWNMALANSGRPKQWRALPPGERVSGSVARLADALFPRPGTYTLVLTVSGVASRPVEVRVTR